MPHSSGGGSSHGGSYHSGSSGGSGSSYRSSHHYFHGSHVFVRYHGGRPHYVYSDASNLSYKSDKLFVFMILMAAVTVFALFEVIGTYRSPERLNSAGVVSTKIEIQDELGVFKDTSKLWDVLYDFYDTTGIIPVIVTLANDEWKSNGYDLEQYAYNWYVANYSDERHWLIMYSEDPDSWATDRFGDWCWEGMQGDDTDKILTETVTANFTDRLHANLLAHERMTKEEAFTDAFKSILPGIMDEGFDDKELAKTLPVFVAYSVIFLAILLAYIIQRVRYRGYQLVTGVKITANNIPLEDVCAYCGGIYIVGTVLDCPHCGANLPPHNPVRR